MGDEEVMTGYHDDHGEAEQEGDSVQSRKRRRVDFAGDEEDETNAGQLKSTVKRYM